MSTADDQRMTTRLVAVVGGGAWGTTLAALASARGATTLWAREPEVVTSIREHHENRRFLSGCELPAGLSATAELEEALADARIVIVAVPAQHMRAVMERASPWLARDALIVSVTKGIEVSSSQRMTQVLTEVLAPIDASAIGVLAGPNLARRSSPGTLGDHRRLHRRGPRGGDPVATLRSDVPRLHEHRRRRLRDGRRGEERRRHRRRRRRRAGLRDEHHGRLGHPEVAEVARLGIALGGDPLTFLGLAGNGDLIATCGSRLSRNHRVGRSPRGRRSKRSPAG